MTLTKKLLCLLLLVLLVTLAGPVSASTNASNFSVSELGFTGPQTLLMYEDGHLIGTYNTSSDLIPIPDHDFQLIIKPEVKNRDMQQLLSEFMTWVTEYWYVLVFFIGGLFLATRRW